MYWSFKSLPECEGLSASERKACWQFCNAAASKDWRYLTGVGAVVALAMISGFAGKALIEPDMLGMTLGGAVGGGLGGALITPLMMSVYRPHARRWRQQRGR